VHVQALAAAQQGLRVVDPPVGAALDEAERDGRIAGGSCNRAQLLGIRRTRERRGVGLADIIRQG
jgi:hypothetical protein